MEVLKSKFRLTSPWTQNFISGIILFLTVGIYLAVIGLGAGGGKPSSAHVATITYTSIYAVFAVTGFFGGSIMNTIGPRRTMTRQIREHTSRGSFFCSLSDQPSAHLWPYGISINETGLTGVPTSVYLTFIIIMSSAIILSLLAIQSPQNIVRDDGTHLAIFEATDIRTEVKGCIMLMKDWKIVALIVPMIATEMSSALIPTLSAYAFNLRTRSLNSVIFWAVQIPSTFLYSLVLDNNRFSRRVRGIMALTIAASVVVVSWALALKIQVQHQLRRDLPSPDWDWTDSQYGEFSAMLIFTGIAYAIDQMIVMWVISAFSNEPRLLARYGGFFKGMLSAGLCIAFGLESGGVSYLNQTIIQSTLTVVSFPIMYFLVIKCVKETNYFTEATVIPPEYTGIQKSQASAQETELGKSF
ncbi:membrane transporter [Penicillium daleae]|uniref:Membrane transporter n=1 Tax=Penicillium daleae TaxID=63821 RepID=A0AAD6BYK4_9EURO|nr:membrane transporter [Penicillium daleae]KAJ5438518.1 membrane transporter [Penicillium daleae]